MSTFREQVLQAVRTWLMDTARLTDEAAVIFANRDGPRPPLPYLTIDVTADVGVGSDESRDDAADVVTVIDATEGEIASLTVDGELVEYEVPADATTSTVASALADLIAAEDGVDLVEVRDAVILVQGAVLDDPSDLVTITDDQPVERAVSDRRATVSVQGFGDGADAILELVAQRLPLTVPQEKMAELDIAIRIASGPSTIDVPLDSGWEQRLLLELVVDYARSSDRELLTPMEGAAVTHETTGSSDLDFNHTYDIG